MTGIEIKLGKNIMGHVKYVGRDEDGNINYEHEHNESLGEHNTVCDLYYDLMADLLAGGSDAIIAYAHCGTSTGGVATDTNLKTHVDEIRTQIDSITQGAAADSHKVVVVATFGAGVCTATLTEAGLFVASAQATADMMLYDDSISYVKGAADTLEITWTITHEN